jgi:hypothetical protein
MLDHGTDAKLTAWLMMTGLFVTISSLLLLPSGESPTQPAPVTPAKPEPASVEPKEAAAK